MGIKPLYQLVKEDNEGRSLLIEYNEKFDKLIIEESRIEKISLIDNTKHMLIDIIKLISGKKIKVLFVFGKTNVYINNLDENYIKESNFEKKYQKISNEEIRKNIHSLFKKDDVIQVLFITDEARISEIKEMFQNYSEINKSPIAGTIIIKRIKI